jgi:tetratricopeptide (TPR) repeat protein
MHAEATLTLPQAIARAAAHWKANEAAPAEILCHRILQASPGQPDALHLLGLIAHANGKAGLAISHLSQACQSPAATALHHSNLAEMCRRAGRLTEGEAAARRAVALDPLFADAWNNLGILLQESGKFIESKHALERTLTLQPGNAQAHNNLGNTEKRLGAFTNAERHWRRALKLRPNYAEPLSNLANLLTDQGKYKEAAAHARQAIALNPNLADAYVNLAGVEMARNRYREALRWLDALLAFAPAHAVALAARAQALKKLDRLPEALAAATASLAAAPQNAEAHNAHGTVLQAMGKPGDALAAYARAADLPGTIAEQALINRALLFMEQGDSAAATAAFAAVLESFPASASAHFNSADLRKFTPGDPAIARMQTLLAATTSQHDTLLLHFALAKAFLDIGDSDAAFHHLNQGNHQKRATIEYDSAATTAWMRRVAKTFSAEFIAARAGQGAESAMPIFVLGMPRSGTTLIEQILSSHPAIHGAGELAAIQKLVEDISPYPESLASLPAAKWRALGQAYLAEIAPLAQGRAHVVDKMPVNFVHAGLIHLILPGAKIIHCRRDPVDTCLSCYTKLFTAEQSFCYDQTELGFFHRDYQTLTAHWRETLPADSFIEVDYESVIADLESEAARLLKCLNLPWNDSVKTFHETKRPVRTASVNQVRRPLYTTSKNRWHAHRAHLAPLLAALSPPGG